MLRKNVAGQFIYFAGVNASTGAALTGAAFSYRRCIDGTFAAGGGAITEDTGLGFYKVALAQADTNGNDLGFFFTATSAIPVSLTVITTAADPTDAVRLGLSGLANAAPGAAGGLFIAGTNAATSITTGLTAHIIGTVDTLTTYTGNTVQTGDSFARIGVAGAGLAGITGATLALAYDAAKTASQLVATDIVSGGAITTSGGIASADVKKINAVTINGDGSGTPMGI